ncbi:hypothetical protein [Oceanobacillus oncorhynchi]|uniref:hypothetical protein n=1 Tax=Oceanobacillus oncorhynchi TaxID=545501 RepID=UPI002F960EF4
MHSLKQNKSQSSAPCDKDIPSLPDILGTKGENKPKASNGSVFTSPIMALEASSSPRKSGISGPTDVIGERNVAAINKIAKSNKTI